MQEPSILVSRGRISSFLVDVSTRDTPGSSDSVPIAGDRRGVPGSFDPVSTAARRGNGSHCGGAGCERMISILSRSTSTFISSVNSSGVCGRLEFDIFCRRTGLERGCCENVFHPSRLPSQYGQSRTFASKPFVPRASPNDAFALVCASRQAL